MIKINIETGRPECIHHSSLPNTTKSWPMKPYKIEKNGAVIEEGYACPKCHRLQVETKNAEI